MSPLNIGRRVAENEILKAKTGATGEISVSINLKLKKTSFKNNHKDASTFLHK